jgi:hypothetical protein
MKSRVKSKSPDDDDDDDGSRPDERHPVMTDLDRIPLARLVQVHKGVLVVYSYNAPPSGSVVLDVQITDRSAHTVYRKNGLQERGKIAFTPDDFDVYEICFTARIEETGGVFAERAAGVLNGSPCPGSGCHSQAGSHPRDGRGHGRTKLSGAQLIFLHANTTSADAAARVQELAKVEKLKPLEMEMRRLEDLTSSLVADFAYMKKREELFRETTGACARARTSSRCIALTGVLAVQIQRATACSTLPSSPCVDC